ncbi:uncharacterized protein LOC129599361 [Paramacrobiotus metropolitanus]|uniref:uncharacterized protein LOC129599361 n=1 Tax=Paramacrobiotus metropolitanus TaxID=2943436 RepID=UPI0024465036|nr:uncharacterized protein LOC129599361 [Paramacrobiotus metropolitanus]
MDRLSKSLTPKKRDKTYISLSSDEEITETFATTSQHDRRPVKRTSHDHLREHHSSPKKSPRRHRKDTEYEVVDLLDHRREGKEKILVYMVKWAKLPGDLTETISWEPESNITGCSELLRKYWIRYERSKRRDGKSSSPRYKVSPKSPKDVEKRAKKDEVQDYTVESDCESDRKKSSRRSTTSPRSDDKSVSIVFKKEKHVGERSHIEKHVLNDQLDKYRKVKMEKERKKIGRVRREKERSTSESSGVSVDISGCAATEEEMRDIVVVRDEDSDAVTDPGSKSMDSGFSAATAKKPIPCEQPEREGSPEIAPIPMVLPPPIPPRVPGKGVRVAEIDASVAPPGYPSPSDPPEIGCIWHVDTKDGCPPSEETWVLFFLGETGIRTITRAEALKKFRDYVAKYSQKERSKESA